MVFWLVTLASLVFLLNLPFGYWRANVPRLTFSWFLAVHTPVPAVIALRLALNLGFGWPTFPPLVGAFFCGQYAGGLLRWRLRPVLKEQSSCLVMDLVRFRGTSGHAVGHS